MFSILNIPASLQLGSQEMEKWKKESEQIAALDPLSLDPHFFVLPIINQEKNAENLVNLLREHLPSLEQAEAFSYHESLAAMRDIGFFLGSLRALRLEPFEVVPALCPIAKRLAQKTNLPPRDTLLHYTIWNPEGNRMRTFTTVEAEICLIKSVQMSVFPLVGAIYDLCSLHKTPIESPDFVVLCEKTTEKFEQVVDAIVYAKRHVAPYLFANLLRHFYEPVRLDQVSYIGPGAVEMPLFVFDHLLWSSQEPNEEYQQFKRVYLPFNQPIIREIFYAFEDQPSLISKVVSALQNPDTTYHENKTKSAKSLMNLCNLLKSFRMPHRKMAEESYRSIGEQYKTGSGGYSTDILRHILTLTARHIETLDRAIQWNRAV